MIDWDEDEYLFNDESYEQFHQYDDFFSDNILKNSGLKKDNNVRRQFVSEPVSYTHLTLPTIYSV